MNIIAQLNFEKPMYGDYYRIEDTCWPTAKYPIFSTVYDISFFIEIVLVYSIICFMCTALYFYLCIPCSVLTIKDLFSFINVVDLLYLFHSPQIFPSGNHYSVLYMYMFLFGLACSLISFLFNILHMRGIIWFF